MVESSYPYLSQLFRFILAKRFWIVAFYGVLLIPSIYFALKVHQDNSPDHLMVKTDPGFKTQKSFEEIFGNEATVFLFFNAPNVFTKERLEVIQDIEYKISQIKGLKTSSLLSFFKERADLSQQQKISFSDEKIRAEFQRFALPKETDLLIRQGLIHPQGTSIGIQLSLQSKNAEEQYQQIKKIDQILQDVQKDPSLFQDIRKLGQPYVNSYLDQDVRSSSVTYFFLFGIFVISLNLFLYRSIRTLFAILIPLCVSTLFTIGFIGFIGGMFTIVSSLIPLTILITATATLVYIHSRFVHHPPGTSIDEHQIFSLSNKFLACTASIFATAVGFAALFVSKIRPIREMGIWVAVGLLFTWLVIFTLFPALQKILKTPTQETQKVAGQWFVRLAHVLPSWSYRYRIILVLLTLLWCGGGIIALFGLPKTLTNRLQGMTIETNPIEYINHHSKLYQDMKQLENDPKGGVAVTELWLKRDEIVERAENLTELFQADMVVALQDFQKKLQAEPQVKMLFGFPDVMEMLSYLSQQQILPTESEELNLFLSKVIRILGDDSHPKKDKLEQALHHWVRFENSAHIRITIRTKTLPYEEMVALHQRIKKLFVQVQNKHQGQLQKFQLLIAGSGVLQVRVSHYMVPTLTESLIITIVIIFLTFLFLFRSGVARVMAMIPSLFAILAMFSIMRLTGISLNIATIVIASTVLGSSENDQIHFFYHYQECKKAGGTTEAALKHAFLVAGQAIFFATLINAGGFLAFIFADLPPTREFGILTSLAFVLSMIADFTVLPAALWLLFRDKPTKQ